VRGEEGCLAAKIMKKSPTTHSTSRSDKIQTPQLEIR
jgi:hypothetical protein